MDSGSLAVLYKGWDGYQVSLGHAIQPRSGQQLAWRAAPHLRSADEIAGHIAAGRVNWLHRVLGLGTPTFTEQVAAWPPEKAISGNAPELARRLESTWQLIEEALRSWAVADLQTAVHRSYQGRTYALSRRWIL